jgi:hypothetical protein
MSRDLAGHSPRSRPRCKPWLLACAWPPQQEFGTANRTSHTTSRNCADSRQRRGATYSTRKTAGRFGQNVGAPAAWRPPDTAKIASRVRASFVPAYIYGTRLGESGADAFTNMRLMGNSKIAVSQKYVHPSQEAMARAVQRVQDINQGTQEAGHTKASSVPRISPKVNMGRLRLF